MVNFINGDLNILGSSPEISRVRKAVKAAAKLHNHVLMLGEVGSGRSFLAQTIHNISQGTDEEFVNIQCSAIGDTIDADEVFGESDGSGKSDGHLFNAGNGTIYLESIDHLSPDLQDRLYNFITTYTRRNGKNSKAISARIIASAEPALEEDARKRIFRFDLFQELGSFRINVPPIRERRQDILLIFTHFLESFCREFGKPVPTIPYAIFEEILEYDWPGNVEEIRNSVRNMVILSPEGELSAEFLPFHVRKNPLESLAASDLPTAVSQVEKFLIKRALARFEGNQSKAAKILQVSEAALRYKMKKYGLASAR
jgi:DNA-binding NtrC family response regulator